MIPVIRAVPVSGGDTKTDLLVDGRYEAQHPERSRRWVGSTNQRFHFLTSRYSPGIELLTPAVPERTVEARIGPDGQLLLTGWPERLDLPSARPHLRRR